MKTGESGKRGGGKLEEIAGRNVMRQRQRQQHCYRCHCRWNVDNPIELQLGYFKVCHAHAEYPHSIPSYAYPPTSGPICQRDFCSLDSRGRGGDAVTPDAADVDILDAAPSDISCF